jgi:hypothetical protein
VLYFSHQGNNTGGDEKARPDNGNNTGGDEKARPDNGNNAGGDEKARQDKTRQDETRGGKKVNVHGGRREKRFQLNILKLVKKNAGSIICHKGNGLATLVGTRDHGLELFDFSNPFPLENGGTPHTPLLFPRSRLV